MTKKITNLPESIKAKLLQKSKTLGMNANETLQRYAMERFLYRLGLSRHKEEYILKGALLFHVWSDQHHRSTRDIDFLGHGDSSIEHVETVIKEICQQALPEEVDDGLIFDETTVKGGLIKEDQEYEGVRLKFQALLGKIPISMLVDVGFGDAVSEEVQIEAFPVYLDLPAPQIKTYPKETVIAEKFQAMVALDMSNSRLKDFYDVWFLSQTYDFDGGKLCQAIDSTFKRRQTLIPKGTPTALTPRFSQDTNKQNQWKSFAQKQHLDADLTLDKIVKQLSQFLMPVLDSLRNCPPYDWQWSAAKAWEEPQRDENMVIKEYKQNLKTIITALKSEEIVQFIDEVIKSNKIKAQAFSRLLGESIQGYGSISTYPEIKNMIAVLDEAKCYADNKLPDMIVTITQQSENVNFKAIFETNPIFKAFYQLHKQWVMSEKLSEQFLGATEENQYE